MPALLSDLNKEQEEAVTLGNQSGLILAGAGSGKTKVLTTRIAWLIKGRQISKHELLAVTFSNKAAKEMVGRVSFLLDSSIRGMWIGTFHALCNRLLRLHHQNAELPQNFQILDSTDQLGMVKRVSRAMGINSEIYPSRQLQNYINSHKEKGLRANDIEILSDFDEVANKLYRTYQNQCQQEGVADFAELLLRAFELLKNNTEIRQLYQARFKHILVDEFQDTNRLQYFWLKLLAGNKGHVFAVGDDDQSIYRFRGAYPGNMKDFEKDFKSPKTIKLEQNYRSHSQILDAANALIRNNASRLGKNLWTALGKGNNLSVYEAFSDIDEAEYLVSEIQQQIKKNLQLSETAVLYRSNAQSRVIEHALFKAGVPYRVYGGLRFFERQEIKHALAYLRLITNRHDDGALLRIINFPARGIGKRTLEKIQLKANEKKISLWEATCTTHWSGKIKQNISKFVQLIEAIEQKVCNTDLLKTVQHIVEDSGLAEHYHKERDGIDRIENLRELTNAALAFTSENQLLQHDQSSDENFAQESTSSNPQENILTLFLNHATLEAGEHQATSTEDGLQLMTVHAAKGLEFQTVFITGLEEGLFPHENSLVDTNGLEEERRLMYVAITRARKQLYITHAQTRILHGQTRYNLASRFLDEIPGELKDTVDQESALGNQIPQNIKSPPNKNVNQSLLPGGVRVGHPVEHPRFGVGVIIQADGTSNNMRVQVNFETEGMKWLVLDYANLTPI